MTLEARMFKAGSKAARESMTASHIPGVAVAGWLIWMVAALVAFWLGSLGISDGWIGLQVVVFILIGLLALFAMLPLIERLPIWIDHRVMVTPFSGLSLGHPMGPEPRADRLSAGPKEHVSRETAGRRPGPSPAEGGEVIAPEVRTCRPSNSCGCCRSSFHSSSSSWA